MRTRFALEQAVHWLYAHDRDLRMPYDRSPNALLTAADYESDAVGGKDRFQQGFREAQSLTLFIRSLVGLDRNAAKEAFGRFLNDARYSSPQIRFVELIIDRLTQSGSMDPGQLYEPPFTGVHHQGLDGVFRDGDAELILSTLDGINSRAA